MCEWKLKEKPCWENQFFSNDESGLQRSVCKKAGTASSSMASEMPLFRIKISSFKKKENQKKLSITNFFIYFQDDRK